MFVIVMEDCAGQVTVLTVVVGLDVLPLPPPVVVTMIPEPAAISNFALQVSSRYTIQAISYRPVAMVESWLPGRRLLTCGFV